MPGVIPIGRSDGKTAMLYADGHTAANLPLVLNDMRLWIDAATRKDWTFRTW